jgi:acetyl-CoA synthetase
MEVVTPKVRALVQDAARDPEGFWGRQAEALPWFRAWDRVLEGDAGRPDERGRYFRWFVGGQTNLSFNCVDRHVAAGRGGSAALVYENERGDRQVLTYAQLGHEVRRVAAALRGLGIGQGDRVGIYMPTCPEAIVLMLACARVGAIHLVVFAGFGAGALSERVRLAGARALFCADLTWRKGNEVPLAGIVAQALDGCGEALDRVVVLRRGAGDLPLPADRTLEWDGFLALAEGQREDHAVLESNEPAYILATSGTTARPKLAVHAHGPYQVYVHTMGQWMFGLREGEVWWSTSDIGWVVGHSYIVYAPLLAGCATVAYEGAIDHPGPETMYRIVEENAVTGLFTSPTAVRQLMRYGVEPARRHDLGSLERVEDRVPVIDHMWQTETAGPIIGNPYGIDLLPIKPGSAGIALPGVDVGVMSPEGDDCGTGEKGVMVIRRPIPGLTATLWGEVDRYADDYWRRIPGRSVYYSGDAASIDEDGYVWFSGRADEIIKIAGHRIGTIEVETAFLRHPAVAEAGVTGRPDEVRMEVISAFVVLRQGREASDELRRELLNTVREELGAVAVIGDLNFVPVLPKTRSGKIMRRVLKAVTLDRDPGDISTIEDEGSVQEARQAWEQMRAELA